MRRRFPGGAALLAASLAMAPGHARAGQVRVTVSSNAFSPSTINLNNGDQVVWVWVGGSHSATSGVSGQPGAGTIFNSTTVTTLASGTAFSWKADRIGTLSYYCIPHASTGMTATLGISASGVPVSSFRITEVQFAEAGGLDRIEITNLGGDTGDLGRYRISVTAGASVSIPLSNVFMVAGQRMVIHCNETGTNNANNIYLPAIGDLPNSGSLALFTPNTAPGSAKPAGASLADANQLVDFVQWGAGGGPNETVASTASYWTSGDFLSGADNPAYSISFCGLENQRGLGFWNVTTPNFNTTTICSTPTVRSSWGRIKQIYR